MQSSTVRASSYPSIWERKRVPLQDEVSHPSIGVNKSSAWPRREVHLVLVICLEWPSLPRKGVEHFNGRLSPFQVLGR